MKWLTLPKMKEQCRVEQDFHDEDEWFEDTGDAVEEAILSILNRSYEDLFEVYGRVPAPIYRASLLLVGTLYKDRESELVQETHTNKVFLFMLKPYMRLADITNDVNKNRYGCKNL